MPRPDHLVVVAGTGTEVGKTWLACRLLEFWSTAGRTVSARKPVQSFDPAGDAPTDARLLAAATGEEPDLVCPHSYPVPMAPPMAAQALGSTPLGIDAVAASVLWEQGVDIGLVESAGGVASPLALDGDTTDLVRLLAPDAVVLVAHAELGTLNAVRLCIRALTRREGGMREKGEVPVVVFVNGADPDSDLHRRNVAWLCDVDGFRVATDLPTLARLLP